MKALDTPVLLAVLRGTPQAQRLLRALLGEELATTEWNLLELEAIARGSPSSGRANRLAALEKLRRRMTIIPIDAHATHAAGRTLGGTARARATTPLALAAMIGAAEASGASEWITTRGYAPSQAPGRCKVRLLDEKARETR